jgi:SAM-dependent methyltransferase
MDRLHPLAARGFSRDPAAYERGRPGYPEGALDRLVEALRLGPSSRLLDLGAGTGKLTRMLVARGLRPVAVEPVEAMRRALSGVRVLAGVAEALPVREGSLDAVVCAQAFHWFDAPRAAAEIRRALRPGGGVALLWNVRDEGTPWVADLGRLLDRLAGDAPRVRDGAWRAAFGEGSGFTPLAHEAFVHSQSLDVEGMVDRVASVSYVAALPDREREAVIAEVRELLATHPGTRGRTTFDHPYRTDLFLGARRSVPAL